LEALLDPGIWVALLTLTVLEVVLGIDNVVFISILAGRLPAAQRDRARTTGLLLAMFMRIGLLFFISTIIGLTAPLFTVIEHEVSGRDILLIVGGLFLLAKATFEIHEQLEGDEAHGAARPVASFAGVIVQIVALDAVFSIDSVLTAVGLAEDLWVMVVAVMIAVGIMLVSSKAIGEFVHRHPTVKMLALSFLLLIGITLIADGSGVHVPKGYLYFAMAFSVFVELLNLRVRARRAAPVELRPTYVKETAEAGHRAD
jgi:predicted tellurium resistance membrane protein TerC